MLGSSCGSRIGSLRTETLGLIARLNFSPIGKLLAYQQHSGAPNFDVTIMIMRLSGGERWPLQIDADFEV